MGLQVWIEFTHSKERLLTGFYEYGNTALCPTKAGTFLECMVNFNNFYAPILQSGRK
jgi:hypothetical protein